MFCWQNTYNTRTAPYFIAPQRFWLSFCQKFLFYDPMELFGGTISITYFWPDIICVIPFVSHHFFPLCNFKKCDHHLLTNDWHEICCCIDYACTCTYIALVLVDNYIEGGFFEFMIFFVVILIVIFNRDCTQWDTDFSVSLQSYTHMHTYNIDKLSKNALHK